MVGAILNGAVRRGGNGGGVEGGGTSFSKITGEKSLEASIGLWDTSASY